MKTTQKLNLNEVDARRMTGLPGIGIDLARRIVSWRTRHGGVIHDWEELLSLRGFPCKKLGEIKARAALRLPSFIRINSQPNRNRLRLADGGEWRRANLPNLLKR
jgi:Helix-hairpin-helix motif